MGGSSRGSSTDFTHRRFCSPEEVIRDAEINEALGGSRSLHDAHVKKWEWWKFEVSLAVKAKDRQRIEAEAERVIASRWRWRNRLAWLINRIFNL